MLALDAGGEEGDCLADYLIAAADGEGLLGGRLVDLLENGGRGWEGGLTMPCPVYSVSVCRMQYADE